MPRGLAGPAIALGVGLAFFGTDQPRARAYGEPNASGAPDREERLLHVLTNQVRQAPHAWPGWDTKLATAEPRRALAGEPGLFTSARSHADDMSSHGFFSHDSSDGTSAPARIARTFSGPSGENLYMAGFAGAAEAITGWMNSEGHRTNMLLGSWTFLGTAKSVNNGLWYYVQNFGEQRGARIPPIPAAAWAPMGPGSVRLIATYYDAGGRAPAAFSASLGSRCVGLDKIAGPAGNETRATTTDMPAGCEPLAFVTITAAGDRYVYPSTGALMVGTGCAAEFAADRQATGCGAGAEPGVGERPVIDAEDGGCSCVLVRRERDRSALLILLLTVVLLVRSRRRSARAG